MIDRCSACDRRLATQADYDAPGEGADLCWRVWIDGLCQYPPVDWRARALAAERGLADAEDTTRRVIEERDAARADADEADDAVRRVTGERDAERARIAGLESNLWQLQRSHNGQTALLDRVRAERDLLLDQRAARHQADDRAAQQTLAALELLLDQAADTLELAGFQAGAAKIRSFLGRSHRGDGTDIVVTSPAPEAAETVAELKAHVPTLRGLAKELDAEIAARDKRLGEIRGRLAWFEGEVRGGRERAKEQLAEILSQREQLAARDKHVAELEQAVAAAAERALVVSDAPAQAEAARHRARIGMLEEAVAARAAARCWSETDEERAQLCRCGDGLAFISCPITICDLAILQLGQGVAKAQDQGRRGGSPDTDWEARARAAEQMLGAVNAGLAGRISDIASGRDAARTEFLAQEEAHVVRRAARDRAEREATEAVAASRRRVAELEIQVSELSSELDLAHQAGAALAVGLREAEGEALQLRKTIDMELGPHCASCGNAIDPDVCWCGDGPADRHDDEKEGHNFIPMGCDCSRHERDWKRAASGLREMLWRERRGRPCETTASIAAWQDETFGPAITTLQYVTDSDEDMFGALRRVKRADLSIARPNLSRAIHAVKKLAELIDLLVVRDDDPDVCMEVADVQIALAGIVAAHGREQTACVDEKMRNNRASGENRRRASTRRCGTTAPPAAAGPKTGGAS